MVSAIVLAIWGIFVLLGRINSKYSFILGNLALFVSFASVLSGNLGFALRTTTYAFGFFAIGAASYLFEQEKK